MLRMLFQVCCSCYSESNIMEAFVRKNIGNLSSSPRYLEGVPGNWRKSQKEGHEEQGEIKELGGNA